MPIQKLDNDSVDVVCFCGQETTHQIDDLQLGVDRPNGNTFENVIRLPPCSECGAIEMWTRHFDAAPEEIKGTPVDEQRRAVNRVATELKSRGKSSPNAKAKHDAESGDPPDIHSKGKRDVVVDKRTVGKREKKRKEKGPPS